MDIKVLEKKDFSQRTKRGCLIVSAIVVPVTIFFCFSPVYYIAVPGTIVLLLSNFYQVRKDHRFFITALTVDSHVTIKYKDRHEVRSFAAPLSEVTMTKKFSSLRQRTAYLLVFHRDKLVLYQLAFSQWPETQIDKVLLAMQQSKA